MSVSDNFYMKRAKGLIRLFESIIVTNMDAHKKEINAVVRSLRARFFHASDRVPDAARFPLEGFTADVVDALKRIYPQLTPLAREQDVVVAFKNGGACSSWLTKGKTEDHCMVRKAVALFAKRSHFWECGGPGYKFRGLLKLHIWSLDVDSVYGLAPGTIDERDVMNWCWHKVLPDGAVLMTMKDPRRNPAERT